MSLDAGQLTTWRTAPNWREIFVFVHQPTVVFKARVNQVSFTYPLTQITFDNVTSGAYTNIREGMTVFVGSAEGMNDLGITRVRANPSGVVATSTVLNIGRSSQGKRRGEIAPTDNTYITVLDLYEIWSVAPRIDADTETTYIDSEIAFSNARMFRPIPNAGCDRLHVLEDGETDIELDFGEVAAIVTNPDATSSLTYAWSFPGCTPSSSTSAAPTGVSVPVNTVTYVTRTVTDSVGTAATGRFLLAVVDRDHANLLTKYTLEPVTTRADGQEMRLRVDESFPESTYPSGTEVLVAKSEWFGSTNTDLGGNTGTKQMVFSGYLFDEDNEGTATSKGFIGRTTVTLHDNAMRLKTLPAFTRIVERDASPARWEQMKSANIDRYVFHILDAFSTVLQRAPFTWSGLGSTYPFPTLGSDGGTLYEQADLRTQAIAHKLTCDVDGYFRMVPDPQLQASGSRTSEVQVSILERDWKSYRFTSALPVRVHWNWGDAVVASSTDVDEIGEIGTVFCVAPGAAPGQGASSVTSGQQLVNASTPQAELNTREGQRYATRQNHPDGYFTFVIRDGDAGIRPAQMHWVRFTISSDTAAPRGRTYSAERFLPIEIRHTYNPRTGTRVQELVCEREIVGTDAETHVPPTDGYPVDIPPINTYPNPNPFPPSPGGGLIPQGTGRIGIVTTDGKICLTTNFNTTSAQGSPTWTANSSLSSSTVQSACQRVGTASTLHVVDNTKIYKVTGVGSSISVSTATINGGSTFPSSPTGVLRLIDTERADPNWVMCISYDDSYGTKCAYSTDGGDTYTEVTITANSDGTSNQHLPTMRISPFIAGTAYAVAFNASNEPKWYKTTNYGATWALSTDFQEDITDRLGGFIYRPYANQNYMLYTKASLSGFIYSYDLKRATSNTNVDISPTYSGNTYGAASSGVRQIAAHDGNANRAVFIGRYNNDSTLVGMWRTSTLTTMSDGTGWELVETPSTGNFSNYGGVEIGGDGESVYVYGIAKVYYGRFSTWGLDDRTGNLGSLTSGVAIRLFGY